MAKTRISDVIVPEVFNPYVVERTTQLSALFQSGIISTSDELNSLASGGGRIINMPFWNDLTGDDEVLSDSGALTPEKIDAGQDAAVLLMRGKAWSSNDLAKALSGDDPMGMIGNLVADYWARRWQALLISMLNGVFASASMASNLHDISAEADPADRLISASTTMDALQLLGDHQDLLTGFVMHSAVRTYLGKQDLIDFVPDSMGNPTIEGYQRKRIITDDRCPVAGGVYTTYIFGQGAIGLGQGNAPVPTETDRDSLAGDDILINRRHFILHPRGVRWTDSVCAGSSPTNVELANGDNWNRVYEPKNIRVVMFQHTIA
jgi:hypothetical protein